MQNKHCTACISSSAHRLTACMTNHIANVRSCMRVDRSKGRALSSIDELLAAGHQSSAAAIIDKSKSRGKRGGFKFQRDDRHSSQWPTRTIRGADYASHHPLQQLETRVKYSDTMRVIFWRYVASVVVVEVEVQAVPRSHYPPYHFVSTQTSIVTYTNQLQDNTTLA